MPTSPQLGKAFHASLSHFEPVESAPDVSNPADNLWSLALFHEVEDNFRGGTSGLLASVRWASLGRPFPEGHVL